MNYELDINGRHTRRTHSPALPPGLAATCLPSGVEVWDAADPPNEEQRRPLAYPLVLPAPSAGGKRRFVACLAFPDAVPTACSRAAPRLRGAAAQKCVCIVSEHPHFGAFASLLQHLHRRALGEEGFSRPLAASLPALLARWRPPLGGGPTVVTTFEGSPPLSLRPPERLPPVGEPPLSHPSAPVRSPTRSHQIPPDSAPRRRAVAHAAAARTGRAVAATSVAGAAAAGGPCPRACRTPFSSGSLSPHPFPRSTQALLLERRVLLRSQSLGALTAAGEGLRALLAPLQWAGSYAPVLPAAAAAAAESAQPYLLGLHASVRTDRLALDGVLVVDLDRNRCEMGGRAQLPELPEPEAARFLHTAQAAGFGRPRQRRTPGGGVGGGRWPCVEEEAAAAACGGFLASLLGGLDAFLEGNPPRVAVAAMLAARAASSGVARQPMLAELLATSGAPRAALPAPPLSSV